MMNVCMSRHLSDILCKCLFLIVKLKYALGLQKNNLKLQLVNKPKGLCSLSGRGAEHVRRDQSLISALFVFFRAGCISEKVRVSDY